MRPASPRSSTTRPRWAWSVRRSRRRHDQRRRLRRRARRSYRRVAVGGNHITMDIARGLSHQRRPCRAAEDALRLDASPRPPMIARRSRSRRWTRTSATPSTTCRSPTSCGSSAAGGGDPRTRARSAEGAGFSARIRSARGAHGRRGAAHRARRSWRGACLSKQVRIGRPLGVQGLPEAAKGPSFAAPVGLLVYPQVAGLEHFVPRQSGAFLGHGHRRLPVAHGAVDQGQFLKCAREARRGGRAPSHQAIKTALPGAHSERP